MMIHLVDGHGPQGKCRYPPPVNPDRSLRKMTLSFPLTSMIYTFSDGHFGQSIYGGFLSHGGTSSHHPFQIGIFPYKPSIFGYPHDQSTNIWGFPQSLSHGSTPKQMVYNRTSQSKMDDDWGQLPFQETSILPFTVIFGDMRMKQYALALLLRDAEEVR